MQVGKEEAHLRQSRKYQPELMYEVELDVEQDHGGRQREHLVAQVTLEHHGRRYSVKIY